MIQNEYLSLSVDTLKELLTYDDKTGLIYYKERTPEHFKSESKVEGALKRFNIHKAGKLITYKSTNGYVMFSLTIKGVRSRGLLGHRVAYLMHHGYIDSSKQIDHINGDRLDNRIENLRLVTCQENLFNLKNKKKGKSESIGVCYKKDKNKYEANICFNYKQIYIGYYNTEKEAREAYLQKKEELFSGLVV